MGKGNVLEENAIRLNNKVIEIKMEEEIWKIIDSRYSVSNYGNVKSNYANKERILKPYKNHCGYLMIDLRNGKSKKAVGVHRLVAMAFIDNPYSYKEVNHKDEIKTNNNVNNLEWCDTKYNCNYGTRNERKAMNCRKKIYSVDKQGTITFYNGIIEASEKTGIPRSNISKVLSDHFPHNKTAGKMKWYYAQ